MLQFDYVVAGEIRARIPEPPLQWERTRYSMYSVWKNLMLQTEKKKKTVELNKNTNITLSNMLVIFDNPEVIA